MEHINPLTPDPLKNATLEFSVANDSIIKGDLYYSYRLLNLKCIIFIHFII